MAMAAARLRAEQINLMIINHLAEQRVCAGALSGDRAAAGAARPVLELVEIAERDPALGLGQRRGVVRDITRPNAPATRRRLPKVIAGLAEGDARRVAAERYANAREKIGSVACASAEGAKTDGGAASNDGGVTTRILHAKTIRVVELTLARAGNAITPGRACRAFNREPVTARVLIDAVCVDGSDLKSVLTRAGWSGQRRDVATLRRAVLECLEDMARALGLVAPGADRPEVS